MAKFKVGDRVWFKAPVTGVKVTAKITATLGGEKYGFVDDDGIQGTIEGNAIYPLNSRACNSQNPVVRNAMNAVAMNKPYDMPMDANQDERVDIRLEEFNWQYGIRENPRPIHTTFDKISTYIERWGLAGQKSAILRALRKNEKFTTTIPVELSVVFSRA